MNQSKNTTKHGTALFVCKKLDMHTLIKCALNLKRLCWIALFECV